MSNIKIKHLREFRNKLSVSDKTIVFSYYGFMLFGVDSIEKILPIVLARRLLIAKE